MSDHRHHLITPSSTGVTVRLEAVMTGPLAPVLWGWSGRSVRCYLQQEAAGLRQRCELPR